MDEEGVLREARGRCQCTGQCGHTHAWTAEAKPQKCGAPQGCAIVRKIDYPSYWGLAGSGSFTLEHAEHYATDKPILVDLRATTVPDGKEGKLIAACQRCKLLIEDAAGTGKKRRRKPKDGSPG